MSATVKTYDKEFNRALSKMTWDGLRLATQHYHSELKMAVNVSNEHGKVPSKAGEPPHKGTGFGQAGIVREFDRAQMASRVGVTKNAIYMAYLDLGTKHIARRPFFIPVLNRNKRIMARLFMAPPKPRKS